MQVNLTDNMEEVRGTSMIHVDSARVIDLLLEWRVLNACYITKMNT